MLGKINKLIILLTLFYFSSCSNAQEVEYVVLSFNEEFVSYSTFTDNGIIVREKLIGQVLITAFPLQRQKILNWLKTSFISSKRLRNKKCGIRIYYCLQIWESPILSYYLLFLFLLRTISSIKLTVHIQFIR